MKLLPFSILVIGAFVSATLLIGCEPERPIVSTMQIDKQTHRLNNMDVVNEYDGKWTKVFLTNGGITFLSMYHINFSYGSTGLYFYLPTKTLTAGTYNNDRIPNQISISAFTNYNPNGGTQTGSYTFYEGEVTVSEKKGIYTVSLNNFIERNGATKLTVSYNGSARIWN